MIRGWCTGRSAGSPGRSTLKHRLRGVNAECGPDVEGHAMKAKVGDRLILEGTRVGEPRRYGVILALRHDDGTPPYLVRWLNDNHEGLVYPGPDGRIEAS
jgi:Domain of unknown function (DUF1918)